MNSSWARTVDLSRTATGTPSSGPRVAPYRSNELPGRSGHARRCVGDVCICEPEAHNCHEPAKLEEPSQNPRCGPALACFLVERSGFAFTGTPFFTGNS